LAKEIDTLQYAEDKILKFILVKLWGIKWKRLLLQF
jgi:hypothetical protein